MFFAMAQQAPKRAYEAPQFTVHGTLGDKTLAGQSGNVEDGAGGYNDAEPPPQLS